MGNPFQAVDPFKLSRKGNPASAGVNCWFGNSWADDRRRMHLQPPPDGACYHGAARAGLARQPPASHPSPPTEHVLMRIAYLILVHNQPAHVARLVRALASAEAWCFIHVEQRSDITPFRALLGDLPQVTLLPDGERVTARRYGYGLTQAALNLLAAARRTGARHQRYCLLSGADYPIKPAATIAHQLAADVEYVRVDRRLASGQCGEHLDTVRRLHFFDWPLLHRLGLSNRMPRPLYRGFPLYHGSQWWALTDACVDELLAEIQRRPGYTWFHRFSRTPDEIYFQSLVKHSSRARFITHDFERAPDQAAFQALHEHGAHYVDWSLKPSSHPRVLTMADLPAMLASNALFARKFDVQASAELLDCIDRHRLGAG